MPKNRDSQSAEPHPDWFADWDPLLVLLVLLCVAALLYLATLP